jgi:hypothetical protein
MALKQVQITEEAEKKLKKMVDKRRKANLPYGRKSIIEELILKAKA